MWPVILTGKTPAFTILKAGAAWPGGFEIFPAKARD